MIEWVATNEYVGESFEEYCGRARGLGELRDGLAPADDTVGGLDSTEEE